MAPGALRRRFLEGRPGVLTPEAYLKWMKLPPAIRQQFKDFGKAGGLARARSLPAAERQRIARLGSIARWTRERFGTRYFEELGLPGAEIIDRGFADVAGDTETVHGLLVAIAAARLRREGVPVPPIDWADPATALAKD